MSDLHFTMSDIVMVLTILAALVGLLTYFDNRRKNADDRSKKAAQDLKDDIIAGQNLIKDDIARNHLSMDHRVTILEGENRQWLAKSDIEKEFEHEKKNRIAADDAAAGLIRDLRKDVTDQGKEIAKLEQNDGYLTNQINDLKSTIDKGFSKTADKIDKLCESVAAIDKKVA